ncbi:MarR family transcriptional regulator [Actinomycetospora straminea]|uniref:MarR family transcriptional regulator n=1 Tax=Actinomycetospora straminea TaxID=663607 RepID=UPI0023667779|nr:MarR family transcriptional regulator [Actinomycetospora straminea]MDD7934149.1 MarR family transcriptional regulator [Actinomycetospora straminea]
MEQSAVDRQREDDTDELLTLLLDDLGPSLQWYRDEVARRLGLTASELLCLDVCRCRGPISSGRIGEYLGLTRSAVAKMVRRLEAAGHVVRELPQGREQDVHVRLRPHATRDALLEGLREEMRRSVQEIVDDHGIRGRRHALVARLVIRFSDTFFGTPAPWPTRPPGAGSSPSGGAGGRRTPLRGGDLRTPTVGGYPDPRSLRPPASAPRR